MTPVTGATDILLGLRVPTKLRVEAATVTVVVVSDGVDVDVDPPSGTGDTTVCWPEGKIITGLPYIVVAELYISGTATVSVTLPDAYIPTNVVVIYLPPSPSSPPSLSPSVVVAGLPVGRIPITPPSVVVIPPPGISVCVGYEATSTLCTY